MRTIFAQSLLFFAVVSVAPADGLPVTHSNIVQIPDIPQPGYLESYIDPVFGSKITRITGEPGTDILNIESQWSTVARHHYSKDAAWNCDQSILLLAKHQGRPSKVFLDGTTYVPLFGRNGSPGTESRWHPDRPDTMVSVKDNIIGYWDVRKDKTEIVATFPGYSRFRIGPWEGNLSLDGSMTVERIAHLHTKRTDYLTEAHAVPSPDGNRVPWAGTWGAGSGRPIGAYVAQRAASKEGTTKDNNSNQALPNGASD